MGDKNLSEASDVVHQQLELFIERRRSNYLLIISSFAF